MGSVNHDLAIVGGGLAGASLALAMARSGADVAVVERETEFKDRVRGEGLTSWGVAEAHALGIYDLLKECGGCEIRMWYTQPFGSRDLTQTTPQELPAITFYHPRMQECLLEAAADAGADVHRGARIRELSLGADPTLLLADDSSIRARLIVGADGRQSSMRRRAGFDVQQDSEKLWIAGVLLQGSTCPEDLVSLIFHPHGGTLAIVFPQQEGRVRAYVGYHKDTGIERFQGEKDLTRFVDEAVRAGAEAAWYDARIAGPLATFSGADSWVEHPFREGVALVGDAAATSDPSFGQGLALTLRDVRVLRDRLLAGQDWEEAGHAYAEEHDRYYGTIHTAEDWLGRLMVEPGADADRLRERVFARVAEDPTILPDVLHSGPDLSLDESARQRLFGEGSGTVS